MSRTTALRAFMVTAPLAFAALLTRHPMGGGDLFSQVSGDVGWWLTVHLGSAILFPAMALVVWLLLRDARGGAATVARCALPVFAVFYGVWEAMFGIANGLLAQTGNTLSGEARRGVAEASEAIVSSPWFGELSVFGGIGSLAWTTAIVAAILALRRRGASRAALVALGVSAVMVMHVPPIGPVALIGLAAAAYLVERERVAAPARSLGTVPA